MIAMIRAVRGLPAGFQAWVLVWGSTFLAAWALATMKMGLGLGLLCAMAVHTAILFCGLHVSTFVPRFGHAPTYTLHEALVPYRRTCPPFESREDFPSWVQSIEAGAQTIQDEFAAAVAAEVDSQEWVEDHNRTLMTRAKSWQHMDPCKRCPQTMAILRAIPGFREGVTFSKLAPRSRIKVHSGESDMYYRGHVGIRVPGPLPKAGFRVGRESQSWENGKVLLFCDSYRHTAWNDYDEERVILLFNVLRPQFAKYEAAFTVAYDHLLFLKEGITSTREPWYVRPAFVWLSMVMVFYLNVARKS